MNTEIVANGMTREQIVAKMDELSDRMYDIDSIEISRYQMAAAKLPRGEYEAGLAEIRSRRDTIEEEHAQLCIAIGEEPPYDYLVKQARARRAR